MKTADLCREHGISAATFYGWKQKFGRRGAAREPTPVVLTTLDQSNGQPTGTLQFHLHNTSRTPIP